MAVCASMGGACESDSNPGQATDTSVTSDAVADTTTAPDTTVASETTEPDTNVPTCGALSLTGALVASDVPGAFTLGGSADLGLGDERPDALVFEFYTNQTGSFDLGAGENLDYATCDQCVRVVQDIDGAGNAQPRHFFQRSGRIVIDPTTPPESGRLKVELRDLVLEEVTIFADYHTEPVAGGGCYHGPAALPFETAPCVPTCGERVCGPDGCGGTCGAGCSGGDVCTLDGATCTSEPGCHTLSLRGGSLANLAAGVYRLDTTSKQLGAMAESDFLQLEFYSRLTGSFDLAEAPNDDYATCKQCVRMVLDGKRDFFQAGGTLVVDAGSDPLGDPDAKPAGGALSARLEGVRLIEVVYDEETFHAEPVPGGACVDLIVEDPFERVPPEP